MTDAVSLTGVPDALANALGISLFPAQILASLLFMSFFLLPILFLTKGKNIILAVLIGISCLSFTVAIGWLPFWTLVVIVLMTSLMFAGSMRDWISGKGHG
jgi:hypothetical protein